jgi:hypothetical protein
VSNQELIWEASEGEWPITEEGKSRIVRVLARLFHEGLMVPGDLEGPTGFQDWTGPASDWLDRSSAELERFNWRSAGDGFWLRLTELGERVASESEETVQTAQQARTATVTEKQHHGVRDVRHYGISLVTPGEARRIHA